MGSPIDVSLIPEESLGIYIAGELQPFYVQIYRELIIGRPADAALEAVLDLTELNAANHGVSKRHAMIRRSASGFEVLDLGSRNGTWLEGERLIPNKPYPLASGSQLRLGQMRLRVMYHPVLKNAKKG
jgi:pSer/pThr/pTyr-binding forkhead associated (FHA) protein